MSAYYNENDPKAAAWLRELIAGGHIAPGDVDDRSILDVQPKDLNGYTQAHFFAGIGGWSLALRLAGWPDDRPVWTGSCPCQPFSSAGAGKGTDDDRHLWPVLFTLIKECRPATAIGEQVASKDGLAWLDLVSADLDGAGYTFGAADLCAAGVGAPHIRQRLYWVADSASQRWDGGAGASGPGGRNRAQDGGGTRGLGFSNCQHPGRHPGASVGSQAPEYEQSGDIGDVPGAPNTDRGLGNPHGRRCDTERVQLQPGGSLKGSPKATGASESGGFWSDSGWVLCDDPNGPRWRPVEPGTLPLADGVSGRVGLLRGYGNAIVPQVAAEFVGAFMEVSA